MEEKGTIVVLGAAGRLGRAACTAFARAGWRVKAQARRPLAMAGVEPLQVALEDAAALARAARGADVVLSALNPPYPRWAAEALPLAWRAADLAERSGALLLYPGNVYPFGAAMPPVLREDTPFAPTERKGRLRARIETELAARAAGGRLRAAVLRAGDFFGGDAAGTWLDVAIAGRLASGRVAWPGPLDVEHAWAFLPDLARAFVRVAEARGRLPAFERLHFAGHAVDGATFVAALAEAARAVGWRLPAGGPRVGGMPWPLMRLGAPLVPMWREVLEMRYLWWVPHRLDDARLAALVGPLPATPLPDALAAALESLAMTPRERAAPVAA